MCKACQERGLTWNLGNYICAFSEDFNNNWRCATLENIRNIYTDIQECDKQKYITLNISNVKLNNSSIGLSLWFTWYKQSGTIQGMFILDKNKLPRTPTEEELVEIVKYFKMAG